jgi:NAD(P)-dependent dehydrogenase (short-subunit alcohol dehydrogenase family)
MKVAIADIRPEHLDEALSAFGPSDAVHPIRLDVTDRKAMSAAADEVERVFGKVHVLCNNAGIGIIGSIEGSTYDDWDWMLEVNLDAVFNGVHEFLPRIRAHGEGGYIMSTSSVGGLFAANRGGPYSVTKYAVIAMMDCLRQDLRDENIGVSILCPAGVRTQIHKSVDLRPEKYRHSGYPPGELIAGQSPEAAAAMRAATNSAMDPLEIGEQVLDAIRTGQFYIFTDDVSTTVAARRDALLASLPDEPINQARLQADLMSRQLRLKRQGG